MPPRISKHFANRAKCYFLFYGCGNRLRERLSFLPRDTEETVTELRWEPKSPELQRCVLVTHRTKVQWGESAGHCLSAIIHETSGDGIWNWCWRSFSPWSLSRCVGGGAEQGRIQPGRMLVSSWAVLVRSDRGWLWKENDFWLLLTWGKAQSLTSSLPCPKHLYKVKIIINLLH